MHAFTRRQGLALAAAAFAARPSAAAEPAALRAWPLDATPRRTGILGVKAQFKSWRFPRADANVRQIHGRRGEVWLPESGTAHLSSLHTS